MVHSMLNSMNRRAFLAGSMATAAVPMFVPASALGLDGATPPSNRITVAAIGLGFAWDMFVRHPQTQFVAVCDVQQARRDAGKGIVDGHYNNRDCATYKDYREVLDRPDIDAVYIATPDHWHAKVTTSAARAGKHIYCQKPLTRTIAEGRAVIDAVRRHDIVFQHGTQQRQDLPMLFGCELVRNGYIGKLQHVKIGSPAGVVCDPQPPQPVPAGLDWEMWLGPAPWSPFTPLRIAAHPWYHIQDYSLGYIAGWGVHHADSAQQGSGLDNPDGPIEVDARGLFPAGGLYDDAYRWQMHYKFANGVTWHWTDVDTGTWGAPGTQPPPPADWPQHDMGIRFEGSEGWVFIWRGVVDAHPKSLLDVKIGQRDKVQLCRPTGEPIPDFIDCVRRHQRTSAPVEVAHRSTTLCALGAISMRLGRKIVWDPIKEEFLNDPEANRMRSRAMREPWGL